MGSTRAATSTARCDGLQRRSSCAGPSPAAPALVLSGVCATGRPAFNPAAQVVKAAAGGGHGAAGSNGGQQQRQAGPSRRCRGRPRRAASARTRALRAHARGTAARSGASGLRRTQGPGRAKWLARRCCRSRSLPRCHGHGGQRRASGGLLAAEAERQLALLRVPERAVACRGAWVCCARVRRRSRGWAALLFNQTRCFEMHPLGTASGACTVAVTVHEHGGLAKDRGREARGRL
jgi:hypothetical protein